MNQTNIPSWSWSFSSLGCPELDLAGIVELAKSQDLRHLELRTVEDRVDLPALFRERYGSPEKLRGWLDEKGMRVVALDSSLKLVGNKEEDREAFLAFMEWAEALDTPWLRVFDGGTFAAELGKEDLEAALETIRWWREEKARRKARTDIMIETHDCLTASAAVRQLQSHLEEPAAILWDTHHTWKKGGEDPAATWAALQGPVPHVHIKDSVSEPSARHPFTYVQLGEGEFDLDGTLSLLRESGFDGIVSIEWERKWHPYLPPLESALKRARSLGWW